MALDQSALLDVLDALQGAEIEDRIKQAATTIYRALIEAELSSVIDTGTSSGSPARAGSACRRRRLSRDLVRPC